jgi:hypothetical protein
MRKKLLVGGGLIAALVVVALAVLLLVDFDSPSLGKAVLEQVSARTGLKIEADGFRLSLLRGLRMEGVRVASVSPSGKLTLQAKGFLAEHRLLPLLRGRVKIDRIVIYEPRIELVTPPKKALRRAALPKPVWKETPPATPAANPEAAASSAGQAASGPALAVDSIRLQNGTLAARTEGAPAPDVEIRGLDVDLRDLALADAPTAIQGLRAGGDLHTGEILLGGVQATEGSGKLRLADGHFILENFGLKLPQGRFLLGQLDADLNRDPFAYRLNLGVDPLDTNAVLAAGPGGGFGPGVVRFAATGSGTETLDMDGEGTLALAAGRLPGSPLFTAIETVLGRSDVKGSAYQPVTIPFQVRANRLHLSPFEVRTSLLALGISGWADLAGPVDLRIAVRAPRDAVALARVPPQVLDLVDDGGWVTVPLRVLGTPQSPRVTADSDALRDMTGRAVRTVVREQVKKGVSRVLGKLFGNR